jgi:SAM-dependent methyltransferase
VTNQLRKVIRIVLILLRNLRVPMPLFLTDRVDIWKAYAASSRVSKEVFDGRRIRKVDDTRWELHPMPSESDLSSFYSTTYWAGRGSTFCLVNERDLSQYSNITKVFSELLSAGTHKRFLNFGSGHGGVSYLALMRGFEVINFDPFLSSEQRFTAVVDLDQVVEQVDFIYASHSLEHVADLQSTLQNIDRLLAAKGYLFVEVPNTMYPHYSIEGIDGSRSPIVQIPHTQYFSIEFFRTLGYNIISLCTYRYEGDRFGVEMPSNDGEVIRFLGKKG